MPSAYATALAVDPAPADVVDFVGCQRSGPVAILTLARPEQHNALNLAAWQRIGALARELASDETLRAVVLRGAGGRAFGAGADIAEFPTTRMTARAALVYNESVAAALDAVAALPVPVLAMIDGLAVGGGLELSAAADLRIATTRSRFGIPIGRLGVTLGLTEARALVRLIGPAELKYLLFSGRLIDAERAAQVGLVQSLVAPERLVDEVTELLDAITAGSLPTLHAAKAVVDMTTRQLSAADTELLARIAVEVYDGPDLAEGVAAFTERRSPAFPSQLVPTEVS